jgi:hypothetical protein
LKKDGWTTGDNGGFFTLGALDTTNCGPIIGYQPLSSASYWMFDIGRLVSYRISNSKRDKGHNEFQNKSVQNFNISSCHCFIVEVVIALA